MNPAISAKASPSPLSIGRAALSPARIQSTSVKVATVIVALLASVFVDGFASTQNLSAILFMTVSVGVTACGLALVTISGNLFMLSLSATASISTIIFASCLQYGFVAAAVITLLCGLVFGAIQGMAVGLLKTNPIITSIAAASVITGIGSWVCGGRTVTSDVSVNWLGVDHLISGVPNQVVVLVLALVGCELFLSRMRLGRETLLTGVNSETARLSGLRVGLAVCCAFIIASVAATSAGILIASQTSQGNLSLGSGLDFSAIAAVLVGGIAINGGHGRILDAVIGALFLAVVSNVLLLKGFSLDIQLMVKGAVVIISVVLGALLSRKR